MRREASGASAEAVRAELRRILGPPHSDASERNRKFLAYVVEEAPAGRSDRIEAYAIATMVFGGGERCDPQVAAIRALDPDHGQRVAADLKSRLVAPDLIGGLRASLAKAGLPGLSPIIGD